MIFNHLRKKSKGSAVYFTPHRTIQWTRGETACLIKTSLVKPRVARGGFARVISAVRRFLNKFKLRLGN